MSDINRQIEELEATIGPLTAKLDILRRQKRELHSRAFIAANRITRADVEMSSGDGKPFFGTVWEFAKWLKANPTNRVWAEWNGRIYHIADLVAGRMPDVPGEVGHLP